MNPQFFSDNLGQQGFQHWIVNIYVENKEGKGHGRQFHKKVERILLFLLLGIVLGKAVTD